MVLEDNANSFLFKDMCIILENMEKSTGSSNKLRHFYNETMKTAMNGQSIYPIMRLLLPQNDSERGTYGLKHAKIAAAYVDALNLNKKSADAQALLYWKDPTKINTSKASVRSARGEFCHILEDILSTRVRVEPSTCTVRDVNEILDRLAAAIKIDDKQKIVKNEILTSFCANEQKWLMRIVFQDLKIGLSHKQVLGSFYRDALQRYNECTSLKVVCEEQLANATTAATAAAAAEMTNATNVGGGGAATAGHGSGKLPPRVNVALFDKYSPMLARGFPKRTDQVNVVEAAMKGQSFVMDVKLDGERMACHVHRESALGPGSVLDEVMLVTRNKQNYTSKYQPIADHIAQQVVPGITGIILDGEVCAWDAELDRCVPFGANKSIAQEETDRYDPRNKHRRETYLQLPGRKWLVFAAFDLVYIEGPMALELLTKYAPASALAGLQMNNKAGGCIAHLPLSVRRQILEASFIPVKNRVEMVKYKLVLNDDDAGAAAVGTVATGTSSGTGAAVSGSLSSSSSSSSFTAAAATQQEGEVSESTLRRRKALEEHFNYIINAGEEGLVVKPMNSFYELAVKHNSPWIKMKPEYANLTGDIDVVVLGARYGEGQNYRGDGYSTFLCGIKARHAPLPISSTADDSGSSSECEEEEENNCDDLYRHQFMTLCKVGTGYSQEQLTQLRSRIDKAIKAGLTIKVPNNVIGNGNGGGGNINNEQYLSPSFIAPWSGRLGSEELPHIWLKPHKNSIILQLKCAELVPTTSYSAGYTLRFPRVQYIRNDKPLNDILSLQEIRELAIAPRKTTHTVENADGNSRSKMSVQRGAANYFLDDMEEDAEEIGEDYDGGSGGSGGSGDHSNISGGGSYAMSMMAGGGSAASHEAIARDVRASVAAALQKPKKKINSKSSAENSNQRRARSIAGVSEPFAVASSASHVVGDLFSGQVFCVFESRDFTLSGTTTTTAAAGLATPASGSSMAATAAVGSGSGSIGHFIGSADSNMSSSSSSATATATAATAAVMDSSWSRSKLINVLREQSGVIIASPPTVRPPNSEENPTVVGSKTKDAEDEYDEDDAFNKCMIIVGNQLSLQVRNLIKSNLYDVVHFSYIVHCIARADRGEMDGAVPPKGLYYLSMSPSTRLAFRGKIDCFGDSYTLDVGPEELSLMFRIHRERYECQQPQMKVGKTLTWAGTSNTVGAAGAAGANVSSVHQEMVSALVSEGLEAAKVLARWERELKRLVKLQQQQRQGGAAPAPLRKRSRVEETARVAEGTGASVGSADALVVSVGTMGSVDGTAADTFMSGVTDGIVSGFGTPMDVDVDGNRSSSGGGGGDGGMIGNDSGEHEQASGEGDDVTAVRIAELQVKIIGLKQRARQRGRELQAYRQTAEDVCVTAAVTTGPVVAVDLTGSTAVTTTTAAGVGGDGGDGVIHRPSAWLTVLEQHLDPEEQLFLLGSGPPPTKASTPAFISAPTSTSAATVTGSVADAADIYSDSASSSRYSMFSCVPAAGTAINTCSNNTNDIVTIAAAAAPAVRADRMVFYVDMFSSFGDALDTQTEFIPTAVWRQNTVKTESSTAVASNRHSHPHERTLDPVLAGHLYYVCHRLRLFGAAISASFHSSVTHVITLSATDEACMSSKGNSTAAGSGAALSGSGNGSDVSTDHSTSSTDAIVDSNGAYDSVDNVVYSSYHKLYIARMTAIKDHIDFLHTVHMPAPSPDSPVSIAGSHSAVAICDAAWVQNCVDAGALVPMKG